MMGLFPGQGGSVGSVAHFLDPEVAQDGAGGGKPAAFAGAGLVGIEAFAVDEGLHHLEDHRIIGIGDLEAEAAGFGTAEPFVLGPVGAHGDGLIIGQATKLSTQAYHSSSIVPGGFDVTS